MDPFDGNCTHCVQAFELRRRGLDVKATGLPQRFMPGPGSGGGRPMADIEQAWRVRFLPASLADIRRTFAGHGPGSRGFVAVLWLYGGGHVFSVLNVGATVRFVDPQTGRSDVEHYFRMATWSAYARVDDATPESGVVDEFATSASARGAP